MRDKAIRNCRHNPQKDKGAISRILFYSFKRNRSEYLFFCSECGTTLTWPKLYSSVIAKIGLYLFSFFVSYWLCSLMMEETIGVVAAISVILFIRFVVCKGFSILGLAFGQWEISDEVIDDEKQLAILDRENRIWETAFSFGIISAVLNVQRFHMVYLLLFFHGVSLLILTIRRKWIGVVICLFFVAYSILALLFMRPYSDVFRLIDNALVLITMILLFWGAKKSI